ncbi:KR-domain-containing protein [Aspergillus heteromorphus CBS 117.55]|uniref:KR-domain-containing protein n=1 Tax=Aspergillus heteromorphus CBS 117.55 TaxID=1448321 RepID=A0A317WQZ0_9EURO|nr:KR-domain-containing protein [Aspergillus heteromorphus CBS 117.55]PWY88475.1 KR-domain-containing protein [Aspergillus heteromorphus CBS 117.55]
MALRDALFDNMGHGALHEVLGPKTTGTLNLHRQFQSRGNIDFLLTLSSTTGVLGKISQAAYTVGSAFQDALARYCVSQDLPSTAIDLGIVRSVGAIADMRDLTRHLERPGFSVHKKDDLLHLIQAAIQSSQSQATSFE